MTHSAESFQHHPKTHDHAIEPYIESDKSKCVLALKLAAEKLLKDGRKVTIHELLNKAKSELNRGLRCKGEVADLKKVLHDITSDEYWQLHLSEIHGSPERPVE